MNYIYKFEKIHKNHLVAGVGTAGNIWMVVNVLAQLNSDDELYVDFESNKSINHEEKSPVSTNNDWEYYFKQIKKPDSGFKFIDFYNIPSVITYERRYTNKSKDIQGLKEKFIKRFKLRDDIIKEIELFYNQNMSAKETLGVQIRLTDMVMHRNVACVDTYLKRIKQIIKRKKNIEQIFLATDDETIIPLMEKEIEKPIIYLKNIYRATSNKKDLNPYDRCNNDRLNHNYLLGKEVIMDLHLLSRCQYLLKAEISCVSQLALIFSESIKKVFFVNEHYWLSRVTKKIKRIIGTIYG